MLTYAKSGIKQASCMNHAEVKDQEYEMLVPDCRGELHVCCICILGISHAVDIACSCMLVCASCGKHDSMRYIKQQKESAG